MHTYIITGEHGIQNNSKQFKKSLSDPHLDASPQGSLLPIYFKKSLSDPHLEALEAQNHTLYRRILF